MNQKETENFNIETNQVTFDLVVEALFRFKAAFAAAKLYPPASSPLQEATRKLHSSMAKILGKAEVVEINEVRGELLINGKLLKLLRLRTDKRETVKALVRILESLHIKNITFRAGITMEELSGFVGLLACRENVGFGLVMDESMKQKGIEHIKVNERIYRPVGSDDMVIDGAKDHFEKNRGSLDELMRVLEEINELQFSASGGTIKDETKIKIAEKIFSLKPEFLSKFLNNSKNSKEKIQKEVYSSMTQPQLKESVYRLASVYKSLKSSSNLKLGGGRLEKIRDTVRFMIDCFEDRDIALEVCREFLDGNLEELVPLPPGEQKNGSSEFVQKARNILEKDSLFLIGMETRRELPEIFKGLEAAGEKGLMKELVEKIAEDIQADTLSVRSSAVDLLKELYPVFDLSSSNLFETLFVILREQSGKERDPLIYENVLAMLLKKTQKYIRQQEYGKALPIISNYSEHAAQKIPEFAKRPEYAEKFLKMFSESDASELLIQELGSSETERRRQVYELVSKIGKFIVPGLVERIKEYENYSQRAYLTSLLKEIGEDAVSYMAEEISRETSTAKLKRLVQVLPSVDSASLAFEYLKKAINHPDRRIRVEAVLTLPRIRSEDDRKGRFLMRSIRDRDDLVKREAIKMLGELEYEPAVKELIDIISPSSISSKQQSDMIRQAACMALASIGDRRAVGPLISLLDTPPWYKFSRKTGGAIKISAIQALKQFSGKEVENALKKALKDNDKFVSAAAESALKKK